MTLYMIGLTCTVIGLAAFAVLRNKQQAKLKPALLKNRRLAIKTRR